MTHSFTFNVMITEKYEYIHILTHRFTFDVIYITEEKGKIPLLIPPFHF